MSKEDFYKINNFFPNKKYGVKYVMKILFGFKNVTASSKNLTAEQFFWKIVLKC